jgi:arsenite-transporting ATPase
MSTDQAHSLGDVFECWIGSAPVQIADNLTALEVDPAVESERAWGTLKDYLRQIMEEKSGESLAAQEALVFPGLEELSSLLRILDLSEAGSCDVLVVDCSPTGETLSLLRYPEQLRVLTDKVLPMVRSVTSAFGGLISRATTVPKPRDKVFEELDIVVKRLHGLQKILCDRQTTGIRLVMTPESIVVSEAERSYSWLSAFDFGVDAVYVNRIYPKEALSGSFAGWDSMQEKSLARIKESFPLQKQFYLPLQDKELRGIPVLESVAEQLYGELAAGPVPESDSAQLYGELAAEPVPESNSAQLYGELAAEPEKGCSIDPATIFCAEQSYTTERNMEDGSWIMTVRLPYMKSTDLSVSKDGNDLILGVRDERRRFRLTEQCGRRELKSWSYENDRLQIIFA